MDRISFLRHSFIAAGAFFLPRLDPLFSKQKNTLTDMNVFNLNYAPHDGMFAHHAGNNILDQIQFSYDQGFRSFEDNGFAARTAKEQDDIGNLLAKLGMQMGVFVLDKGGNSANTLAAGKQDYIDVFLKGCHQAIDLSKRSGGKYTTVVPGDFARQLPVDIQTANVIEALRRGAEILEPHGIIMVLEPLSDTPDLFLRTSTQTYLICKGVNSASCKILYDVYHMQRNEGDLIANIDRCWDEIAYFQVGDNPGRNEPTTGEIHYKNLFRYIHDKGYSGVVGMEHGLSTQGLEGENRLLRAYREVDDFLDKSAG